MFEKGKSSELLRSINSANYIKVLFSPKCELVFLQLSIEKTSETCFRDEAKDAFIYASKIYIYIYFVLLL